LNEGGVMVSKTIRCTNKEWKEEKAMKKYIKQELMNHPEKEYIDFIQLRVAEFFKLKVSDLTGKRKLDSIVFPRYLGIKLVNLLTDFEDESMYFFNRDRTSWYDSTKALDTIIHKPYYANALKNLLHLCSRVEFENYKGRSQLNYNWEVFNEVKSFL
jgi:hypothetical protein